MITATGADACSVAVGTVYNYGYTGQGQTLVTPCKGYYKLEVWGAQGGISYYPTNSRAGGYGSYSVGIYDAAKDKTLYVIVGGQGAGSGSSSTSSGYPTSSAGTTIGKAGGYNGGGRGWASGGGATHIATSNGVLSSLSSSTSAVLIVAGGGGGAAATTGGNGGGIQGNAGTAVSGYTVHGLGGTQTAGGASQAGNGSGSSTNDELRQGTFGQGGAGSNWASGGGGGGWYGGGGGKDPGPWPSIGPAGGGSGYISSSSLISSESITKHMTCYSCTTSTTAATRTNSNTNVSSTATADYSKTGNGYARITYLGKSL